MTEKERLDFLLRYHTNLTQQFIASSLNDKGIGAQLNAVESVIESILLDNGSDENES